MNDDVDDVERRQINSPYPASWTIMKKRKKVRGRCEGLGRGGEGSGREQTIIMESVIGSGPTSSGWWLDTSPCRAERQRAEGTHKFSARQQLTRMLYDFIVNETAIFAHDETGLLSPATIIVF